MIIRKDQSDVVVETGERDRGCGPADLRRISDAGGLTQFGAHVVTLEAGSRSSERHWHEEEDEFLYMLSGEATLVEDDGEHPLAPGDAACWPARSGNAHLVVNRSGAPCTYLICGTRVENDVVHYPDLGRVLHIEGKSWRILGADGKLIREGRDEG